MATVQPVGPTHIFHNLQGMLYRPGVLMPSSSITGQKMGNFTGWVGESINFILYLDGDLQMQLMVLHEDKGHCSGVTSWPRWVKSVLEQWPLLQTVFWSQ